MKMRRRRHKKKHDSRTFFLAFVHTSAQYFWSSFSTDTSMHWNGVRKMVSVSYTSKYTEREYFNLSIITVLLWPSPLGYHTLPFGCLCWHSFMEHPASYTLMAHTPWEQPRVWRALRHTDGGYEYLGLEGSPVRHSLGIVRTTHLSTAVVTYRIIIYILYLYIYLCRIFKLNCVENLIIVHIISIFILPNSI